MQQNEIKIIDEDALFVHVGAALNDADEAYKSVSYWGDVWRRLAKNRVSVVCIALFGIIILCSVIIPLIAPESITGVIYEAIKAKPSAEHWFGCDKFGHDVFVKMWQGGRVSFFVGFTAAILQAAIGVCIGCIASYYGGKVDMIIMRIVDILISIPYLIVVLAIRVVMGASNWTIIFALVVTGWLPMCRLVRGQILQLKHEDYIMAAESLGVSPINIMLRHLIPNVLGVIIVQLTLAVPSAMFSEAFLSFIGLGSNAVSWGSLIRSGMEVRESNPLQLIGPSFLLAMTMFCIQLTGDAMRDALDPKLRR